jgi:hypothetical protein
MFRKSEENEQLACSQLDLDFRRRQQCVVNQAVMHRTHQAFRLLFRERYGIHDMDAEVAEPCRLREFISGHEHLDARRCELACSQVLDCIESRTRPQRRQQ